VITTIFITLALGIAYLLSTLDPPLPPDHPEYREGGTGKLVFIVPLAISITAIIILIGVIVIRGMQ
jgi:hypothetical protein